MEKQYYYSHCQMSEKEAKNFWKNFKGCKKVLDLGCGIGLFGKYKPQGVEVHGIDIDKVAINEAKKHENAVQRDMEQKLPYPDNTFDAILAKDVLEHVLRPWNVVIEMKRVLKKGGMVLAVVPSPKHKAWDNYTHVRPFTERSVKELFLDQGFKLEFLKRQRGIPGFGVTGLNVYVPYILKIPIIGWLFTQGYMVKAVK